MTVQKSKPATTKLLLATTLADNESLNKKPQKVAIVHDWLYGGGAERVVLELHKLYPNAPIYTSYCSDEWRAKLGNKVVTGYLQRWPFAQLRKFLPLLRIQWFEHLDLSDYDLVISSSGNGEAKGVKAGSSFRPGQTHICYCHSPTHFYWRHYDQYLREPGFGVFNPLVRFALQALVGPLRKWDRKAAQRADYYIANSTHIQGDIKKYYGRDSIVINPPIDVERFATTEAVVAQTASELPGGAKNQSIARRGFVTVARQVPQKHIDIIVEACTKLSLPLTVVGKGPEHTRLHSLAGPTIVFKNDASDQDVARYVQSAEAFIFAAFDDFGIVAPEALAAGTPVIAYKAGGALDYVEPGITGEFFTDQTAESLIDALKEFKPATYNHQTISQSVQRLSAEHFRQNMQKFIQSIPQKR
jgi:glycosyltransferase involved in cell wall biosynthesis